MAERFRESGKNLLPVSKKAIEQAFPYSTDVDHIQRAILRETVEMHENHPQLLDHFKGFKQTYQAPNLEVTPFIDGAKFMYRILRHHASLPPISPHVLTTYDMEHKRKITDSKEGIKDYFVTRWREDIQSKPENKPLVNILEKVGEKRTNRIEEVWGGAFYVAKAFERQINVDEAHKAFSHEAHNMKQIFPD